MVLGGGFSVYSAHRVTAFNQVFLSTFIKSVLSLPSTMFPLTQNKPPLHAAPLHLGDVAVSFFSCNINVIQSHNTAYLGHTLNCSNFAWLHAVNTRIHPSESEMDILGLILSCPGFPAEVSFDAELLTASFPLLLSADICHEGVCR